ITLAMNMFSQGVEPELDFSDIPKITELYTRVTRMNVYERSPYSGKLVFAAFSGSHQDAIAKGMKWREEGHTEHWTVPYLPIDPEDLGREYSADVIRINSQSGKGGIGYILETRFGYNLPKKMRESVGYAVKGVSDHKHKELMPDEVYEIFKSQFVDIASPLNVTEAHYVQCNGIEATVTLMYNGKKAVAADTGNGRLDAVSNAVRSYTGLDYNINTYTEHSLEIGSSSKAVSYVEIIADGKSWWGAGIDNDIVVSSIKALVTAVNRMLSGSEKQ
ncbi:MAG: 2-isopropylmalate synthase, partial [Ruminococcus sp.]|nr:2-isopropylmalate synthase [Ruminococcus sp.]